MNRLLTRFTKQYNNYSFFWAVGICIMIVLNGMVFLLAGIGLSEMQKQAPTAFHGHFLNYSNLWAMMSVYPIISMAGILLGGISLMIHTMPTQSQDGNRESKS